MIVFFFRTQIFRIINLLQRGLELKKKRRKATKDDDVNSFHSYLSSLEAAYELSLEVEDKEILMEIYNSKLHLFNLVENLTGLQFILQNILENLVIADRVQFLKECQDGKRFHFILTFFGFLLKNVQCLHRMGRRGNLASSFFSRPWPIYLCNH